MGGPQRLIDERRFSVAIIAHVRDRIAHYKAPDAVALVDALPKTSTGKIQKYVLREDAWKGRESEVHGGTA